MNSPDRQAGRGGVTGRLLGMAAVRRRGSARGLPERRPLTPPGPGRNGCAVLRSRSGLRCGRARGAVGERCQAAIGAATTDGDTP
jgi:hypothetical protein